jgi:hypothetical protein
MEKVCISENFKQLHDIYKKKYGGQKIFKSMRYKNGTEPVFYIGVPGLFIAIAMSITTIITVLLLYQPFKWYLWIPYLIFAFFLFRITIKMDKVRQVRFMLWSLLDMAKQRIEKANEVADADEKRANLAKAKEFLEKAHQYVEEAAITDQMAEIDKMI